MKLMTKAIEKRVPPLNSEKELKPIAKFFNPVGAATWIMCEYDPETKTAFGWCKMFHGCGEYGYFSLDELASVRLPLGLKIERDLYFNYKTMDEAIKANE
jgi:hypothetical protein